MSILENRAALNGRRAIVVGGAFGLGRAVSLALAEAGVDLAICDSDGDALPSTIEDAARFGGTVFGECFDALDTAALKRFYGTVGERFGHLDIVVNVVGGTYLRPFEETDADDWQDDIDRNFGYVVHSTRAALPLLRKSGRGGSIVNFTTVEAHRGAATIAVYAGAKAATTNFSRALANELGHERIRINTIAPDMTPSRGNDRAASKIRSVTPMGAMDPADLAGAVAMAVPLGTPPSADDIANSVLFLASDLSSGITGTVLHVDGGTYASSGFLKWPTGAFSPLPPPQIVRLLREDGAA